MTNWAKALSPFDKANTEEEAVAQAVCKAVSVRILGPFRDWMTI